MMESTASLQGSLQKAGPSLQEASLEGATLLKDKSRQKRFMPFLPILVKTFIEGSLPYKSEETQREIQKVQEFILQYFGIFMLNKKCLNGQ
jgi:hypothetical protein